MNKERIEAWRRTRRKGRTRFILVHGLVAWGLPMFIIMAFVNKPFSNGFYSTQAVIHYVIYPVAGLLFGAAMWWYAEKRFQSMRSDELDQ